MSLHDAITDLNEIFFDTEGGFAELVTYIPRGLDSKKFTTPAVVDWGDEEGSNQVRGDGRANLNQNRGRSTRGTIQIELPLVKPDKSPLTVIENGKDRIKVTRHGESSPATLSVKRIIARDEAMQLVLCSFTTEHAPQTKRTRFG